jgi:hypothetical protein
MGASQCRPIDDSLSTADECGSLSSGQMYADPKLATVLVGTGKHLFHLEEDQLCVQRGNEASRKGEIGNYMGEAKNHRHRLL